MDLEDPELPGGDFLINFNKKLIGKWSREDPELSGANSLMFVRRNCKENGPGGS
jgi:hypothetical protein